MAQFCIGSDTKKLTALAALQLVEAGALTLDTTVADLLPDLAAPNAPRIVDATLRMMLAHQNGGVDWFDNGTATTDAALRATTYGAWAAQAYELAPPGIFYNYSNPNYSLAGLLAEEAGGAPFADLLEQRIFAPLGMTASRRRLRSGRSRCRRSRPRRDRPRGARVLLVAASRSRRRVVTRRRVAFGNMRTLALASMVILAAGGGAPLGPDPEPPGGLPDAGTDGATACPPGKAGAACVLALHDDAAGCGDASALARLRAELDARAGLGPLWAGGRALFRTDAPAQIAGAFNAWSTTALATAPLCGTDLVVAAAAVPTGSWPYKLVTAGAWSLDPHNPAFAYDDFAGNADGKNSALVTPDSGRGQLVTLSRACSATLGNCRAVTAYLPPGYDAPAEADRRYHVLFMHDGQNVWDDHDCCFGHTGWEINVTLDAEIAAGRVAPLVVIAAAHSAARNDEYGLSPAKLAAFVEFQITELQPAALAQVRWDGARVSVAGSSLGGLVSMHLALAAPATYAAVASLSGAFWPGKPDGTALRDRLPALGKQPVAVYLDHGGNPATNADGAADSIEIRDLLVGLGWQRADSPACAPGPDALCYFAQPGAAHDELAWQARAWRFLRFISPPP